MRRALVLVVASLCVLAACQDQPEVGPVINRDGFISGVKTTRVGNPSEPYKDVILTGSATCDADESVEVYGNITQGTVRSILEGGFQCKAGETIRWTNNFGSNGAFPPDPRLQPGRAEVRLTFSTSDTLDYVRIERIVTLADS